MLELVAQSLPRIERSATELAERFYATLLARVPGLGRLFPLDPHGRRAPLTDTVVWLLQRHDDRDELVRRLADLGRDHRKHGVTAAHYEAAGHALLYALARIHGPGWTPPVATAWSESYAAATHEMLAAAAAARGAALWLGRVVEHHRPAPDLAWIVVQPLEPVPHRPGQYLSVETPLRPGRWRYLSPTEPARPDGILRFCVRAIPGGLVSPALVTRTRRDDTWRIGPPLGRLPQVLTASRDLLLLGAGTGIAPLHALIGALDARADPPRTHLYAGARDAQELRALLSTGPTAHSRPWLSVTPVVTTAATDHRPGCVAGAALRARSWTRHDVVVCGPPRMQTAAVGKLLAAGIPAERIHADPLPTSVAIRDRPGGPPDVTARRQKGSQL